MLVYLLLLLILGNPAHAEEIPCKDEFSVLAQEAALESAPASRFEEIGSRKVREVFPRTKTVKGEEVFDITPATQKAFQENFDEYWNERVKSGRMAKIELAKFRDWLYGNSDSRREYYPQLGAIKAELKEAKDLTMADLHDRVFLKYVEEVTGGMNPESAQEYLNSLSPSAKEVLLKTIALKWKRSPKIFFLMGLQISAGLLFQNKELNITTHLFSYKVGHPSVMKQIGQSLGDLQFADLPDWRKRNYPTGAGQEPSAKDFRERTARIGPKLQVMKKLVETASPTYFTTLEQALSDHMIDLKATMDRMRQIREEEAALRARAKKRKASAEDQEHLAALEKELGRREAEASVVLADWQVYTAAVEQKDRKESLRLAYENALTAYLEQFDINALRDSTVRKVENYLGVVTGRGNTQAEPRP